jgi:hypothetical protein
MGRPGFFAVSSLLALLAGCAAPGASLGGPDDYQVFPAGDGKIQLVVRGANSDQAELLGDLHRHAARICGVRGYAILDTAADSSPVLDPDAFWHVATVSALVRCGSTVGDAAEELAPDGRPYCPELDPEVERLRPEGYVSPTEGDCVPRPPRVNAATGPAEALQQQRQPVQVGAE